MKRFKFLVLSGDGINCERETGLAFQAAGLDYDIVSVNSLLAKPDTLLDFDGLSLPGGFSFADELGSGQILALKFKHALGEHLNAFLKRQSPIIGICNGFQVLVKLGLLPDPNGIRTVALAPNKDQQFINRWETLAIDSKTHCRWTHSIKGQEIKLPIRHGEGRIVFRDEADYKQVLHGNQIVLRYKDHDPNGSTDRIAGLTDPTGTILGLMPHPEAALSQTTTIDNYNNREQFADGYHFFENIKHYLEEKTS